MKQLNNVVIYIEKGNHYQLLGAIDHLEKLGYSYGQNEAFNNKMAQRGIFNCVYGLKSGEQVLMEVTEKLSSFVANEIRPKFKTGLVEIKIEEIYSN